MAHPLLADPFVKSVIDDAVEPFANRLLPEEVSWLTDQLAMLLKVDPELAHLLSGAHPRRVGNAVSSRALHTDMDSSGERAPLGIDAPADETKAAAAKNGTTK